MAVLNGDLNEESVGSKLLGITVSLVLWYGVYRAQEVISPSKSAEWRCRLVSLIHGVVVTLLSYYSQFIEGPSVFGIEPGLPNNNSQVFIVKVCLGYFLFDLSWCLYYQTEPLIMIVHHCLSTFGMVNMMFQCKWGTELIAVVGGTEISNPILQLRWFLRHSGYRTFLSELLVDVVFISVFGYCRLLVGGHVMLSYVSYPNSDVLGKIGCVTMYGLSLIFYYYILGYAVRKYSRKYAAHKDARADTSNGHAPQASNLVNGVHNEIPVYKIVSNGHVKSQ